MLHCNGIHPFVTLMGNFNWGPTSRNDIVSSLPVHHYSADYMYIFWPFGIIEFIFSHLKLEFRFGGVAGVPHLITGNEETQ